MGEDYISMYVMRLTDRINKFEEQWKGTRFAAIDDSALLNYEEELNENEQEEEFMEKYRCKNGDIKPLGLILYKKYLRSFLVLFLVLFLLFIPVALIYSNNTGLKQLESLSLFSKAILFTSIANLPHYRLDNLTKDNITTINFHRTLAVSSDILATIFIFLFLIWLKVEVSRITIEYKAKSPAPNLYCLELTNIEGCNEEDIEKHFSKFGEVAQVSGIYTHRNIIYELRKIVKMINHIRVLKPDQNEFEETTEKIRKKYQELAETYFSMPKPSLKSVFVCFEKIKDRNRIYDLYKYKINPQKLYFKINAPSKEEFPFIAGCNDCGPFKNSEMSVEHFNSEVEETTILPIVSKCKFEPLTINWENCDINKHSQRIKYTCQFLLLVLVTFFILLGLFIIHIGSSQMKEEKLNYETIQTWNSAKTEQRERYTFCASLGLSQFKWEYYNFCAEYFQIERNRFVLMLTFALMVSVINLLTNRILWALVAFRRYKTLAERNSFLITSIFLFSVINSAVMILFIRDSYTGPILRDIVAWLCKLSKENLNVTVYSEYNRKWYGSIGSQLAMNYIVSLIMFPFFHIVLHWFRFQYRKFVSRRSSRPRKNPILNYCTFYAISLKAIFFTMMYSNSMPVFYLLGCLGLGAQTIVVKVLLHRFVDEPVFVDNQAIQVATNLIPYALVLHCFTSFMFLDVEDIFPNWDSYQNIHNESGSAFLLKCQRGFLYIILIVLLFTFIFFRERIENRIFLYWFGKTEHKAECKQAKKFRDIKSNPAFLASYKMKDNPKYKVLSDALQLFYHHMESIRAKGGLSSISDGSAFKNARMFREEYSSFHLRKNPSMQLMNNQNESLSIKNHEVMGSEIMNNEEIKSEEEVNEEWRETESTNKETIMNKEMDMEWQKGNSK